jgi:hypothetical protein
MAKKLAQIVDGLVDSFHKYGGINHLDGVNLPSRDAAVEIARDLQLTEDTSVPEWLTENVVWLRCTREFSLPRLRAS